MAKYVIGFSGRRTGAIGIFYALPQIQVEAESTEKAVEVGREQMDKDGYEHLSVRFGPYEIVEDKNGG